MSLVIAQFVVAVLEAYVLAGMAFALMFLPRGVTLLAASYAGYRLRRELNVAGFARLSASA